MIVQKKGGPPIATQIEPAEKGAAIVNIATSFLEHARSTDYDFIDTASIVRNAVETPGVQVAHVLVQSKKGVKSPIGAIVLVDVIEILEVTSPLYDLGVSEDEMKEKWKRYFFNL